MLTSAIDNKNASAIQAAREGVAVSDRTHWGRIRISDDDRIRFLHNQSTNDFQSLKSGQGCVTVLVTYAPTSMLCCVQILLSTAIYSSGSTINLLLCAGTLSAAIPIH